MTERNTRPLVSVLMSARNGMAFIAEAIDSIAGQTFVDWELVIVDNASTDGTADYVAERAAAEPRIVLLRNECDRGVAGGLNRGLSVCRGEWVARIDCDDRALPERLERQLAFVRTHPEVRVTSCLAFYINPRGARVARTAHDLTTIEAFRRYMAHNEVIGLLHPGVFAKRETLLAAGGYRPQFVPAEDIDLWNRITETGAIILVQPEYLMEYRVHGGSIMAKSFGLAHLKHQWVAACLLARRRGEAEPGWAEFVAGWKARAWPQRLNQWREGLGRRLYRAAAYRKISGQSLFGALEFAAALVLRPAYAVSRLRSQRLPSQSQDKGIDTGSASARRDVETPALQP